MATYNVSISEAASAADSVGVRMVSDAQYSAWLAADHRERVLLVEAKCWDVSVGAEVTRYMSDRGYTSQPGESPANTAYEDIVVAVPEIRSWMAEAFRGRSLVSYGDIEIDNSAGVRDDWLEDGWDKRDVRIYLGDPSWFRSDFRQVFFGTIQEISARDGRTLVLRIKDRQELLDKPLQTRTVAAGPKTGLKRPVCYGHCLHAEGVLSSSGATTNYEFHDGPLSSIDNYFEDGHDITGSVTRVAGGGSGLGAYVTYTGNAIGMTQKVATAHVKGFESKTGDIVKRILIERAGLSEADIDPAAISAYNSAVSGAPVGFYSNRDDETIGSALDTLIVGIGGYYSIDRNGRFTGGVLGRPIDGTSVLTLTEDDIEDGRIEVVRRIVPPKTIRLGYERYWRPITAPNTSGVTSGATIEALRTEYRVLSQAMYAGSVYNSKDETLDPSCFYASAGASSELIRRYTLWYDLRFIYRVRAFVVAQSLKIGDCVTLTLPRYGFDSGAKTIIVGMRESLSSGYVELELFK